MNNIHAGHRKRMREKLLKGHADSLCEHELLEMLLFYCIPMVNTNNIAHEMINTFGSISGALDADMHELMTIVGINRKVAEKFLTISKFIRQLENFCESTDAADYFIQYFKNIKSEICLVLDMDSETKFLNKLSIPLDFFSNGGVSGDKILRTLLKNNMNNILVGIKYRDDIIPKYIENNIIQFFSRLEIFNIFTEEFFICTGNKTYSVTRNILYHENIGGILHERKRTAEKNYKHF